MQLLAPRVDDGTQQDRERIAPQEACDRAGAEVLPHEPTLLRTGDRIGDTRERCPDDVPRILAEARASGGCDEHVQPLPCRAESGRPVGLHGERCERRLQLIDRARPIERMLEQRDATFGLDNLW